MTSTTSPLEGSKARGNHKLLAGLGIFLGLALATLVLFSHRGLYQIYHSRHERQNLEQQNARLAEENARLARTIDRLQNDPEMIQELIRRELNFIKKNEIIFQLPPGRQSKPSTLPSPAEARPQNETLAKPAPKPEDGRKAWAWESLEGAPQPGSKTAR